jgi:hypothetical protein
VPSSKRCDESRSSRTRTERAHARRALAVLAVVVTHGASIALAHADPRRLAVLGGGASLKRSVDVALDPWDVDVVLLDDAPPDALAADAVARAASIAERHRVDAVAWFRRTDDETVLWLFDARTHTIQQRTLGAAALAESARDASLALSLKTLIRASVAPPAPLADARREAKSEGAATGPTTDASTPTQAPALRLEGGLALRAPLHGSPAEPRIEVGVTRWLSPSWGLGLAVGVGPGVTFDGADASGSRTDAELRASIRARAFAVGALAFEPRLGASLHAEEMRATRREAPTTRSDKRLNASLEAGLALVWRAVERLDVSLGVEARYALRYPRFLVGERVVFAPSPVALQPSASVAWSF